MLKEYKYYSVNVDITDGKGRPFRVKVVINSRNTSNLMHPLLVN